MNINLVYRIENLVPPINPLELGGWGFEIHLDREFAKKCKDKKLTEKEQNRLQEIGKEQVVSRISKSRFMVTPYQFFGDSLLIQACKFGGDDCGMGVRAQDIISLDKEDNYNNCITYNPHNVDHMVDAMALQCLFLRWLHYSGVFLE